MLFRSCPEHGEFWQTPNDHLDSCGCPKCFNENKRGKSNKLTKELFILRARELYGDKYDYSKVEYNDCNKKVCIICPEHGEFWQTPHNHISQKQGCPFCKESHLAKEIKQFLIEKNILFEQEKGFDWLKNKRERYTCWLNETF